MKSKLPIGSVIRIKDNKDRYIIIGKDIKTEGKEFDYVCAKYPYGFTLELGCEYYNDEDVTSLCFLGDVND